MSLITKQLILQLQSDRSDILHRLSVGEDSQQLKNKLNGINKRLYALQKQVVKEQADADAAEAASQAKKAAAAAKHEHVKPRNNGSNFEDINISCMDCASPFVFTISDQYFYIKNGWKHPTRCATCREAKKNAKPEGTNINCSDCKNDFFFSDAKQRVFEEKGWVIPKRCAPCKSAHAKKFASKSSSNTTNVVSTGDNA